MIYIHMNKGHQDYTADLALCEAKHKAQWATCNLGVNTKKDDTEVIVKVDGADASWATNTLGGSVITVYTDTDHPSIVALVNHTAWAPEDPII